MLREWNGGTEFKGMRVTFQRWNITEAHMVYMTGNGTTVHDDDILPGISGKWSCLKQQLFHVFKTGKRSDD